MSYFPSKILSLQPGMRLGPFLILDSVFDIIKYIQWKEKDLSGIEISHNEENPLSSDLVVDLTNQGIRLRFDPKTQLLNLIDVYDFHKNAMSFKETLFSGPLMTPTKNFINRIFGSTFPMINIPEYSLLCYPGVSFAFPREEEKNEEKPSVASRLFIYPKDHVNSNNQVINARIGRGIYFRLQSSGVLFNVDFTSHTQDVVATLGYPDRVFHPPEYQYGENPNAETQDYFYNYFSLGFDLLFDGRLHLLKLITLHTNFPGRLDFNNYKRYDNPSTPVTTWPQIQQILGKTKYPPKDLTGNHNCIIWKYCSDVIGDIIFHVGNPFHETFCFAYNGINFEVMSNNYISTISLFPIEKQ